MPIPFRGIAMVKLRRWFWRAILPLAFVALVLGLAWSRSLFSSSGASKDQAARETTSSASSSALPLIGTASCSARGCHGGIDPVVDPVKCQQNEYSQWAHDRHADAYRVLFNERSQDIARLLGGQLKAHEDPRCLACHTNPLLAGMPAEEPFVQQEKQFGVGCESCHGSANQWLVAHTAADWRAKKAASTMPDLTDPSVQARACVGCHVGAPARKGMPLRDVNHDLLAAGHPRLHFEFGAYQANMPAHWRPRKKPGGHLWAIGQLVSAQASLELLSQRAKAGPWPEFAEYDCFACHHSLAAPNWRQARNPAVRKLGTLPWGTWYFALIPPLAGESPALHGLEAVMQHPLPQRQHAADKAQAVLKELQRLHIQMTGAKKEHDDLGLNRQRLLALVNDRRLSTDPSWDGIEQTYLAMYALNQAHADAEVVKLLREWTPLRAFPAGFDSPLSWPRNGGARFDPRDFIEGLKRLR